MFGACVAIYIFTMVLYVVLVLAFDLTGDSAVTALMYGVGWPLIFAGCLFALPFVAFVKLVREDDKNNT